MAAVGLGLRALTAYENKPGAVGAIASEWPSEAIHLGKDRATLVMVAHPRCPCTEASVGELARIMAETQGKIAAYVLFATPREAGADWEETGLRRSAAAIPGVKVVTDFDGTEAKRFGAETSGHTLLFSTDGRLLFTGGITVSRGHAGPNEGENAIIALANGNTPVRRSTLVFGCRIAGPLASAGNTTASR